MMGVFKYTITVESDALPQVVLGQNIGGGIVKELKEVDIELFSASQLAEKYNMSQQQSEIVLCQLIKALKARLYTILAQPVIYSPQKTKEADRELINLSSMKYFSFLASFGKLAYLDLSNKPLQQP